MTRKPGSSRKDCRCRRSPSNIATRTNGWPWSRPSPTSRDLRQLAHRRPRRDRARRLREASPWTRAAPCSARPSPPPWTAGSPWPSKKGGRTRLPRGAPRTLQGPAPADRPDRRRARHPGTPLFRLPDLRARRLRRRPRPRHRRLRHPRGLPDGLPAGRRSGPSRRPRWPCPRWPAGTSTTIPSASSATPPPRGPASTRERRATAEAFARAEGDLELQIDAGKVNTPEGWRDVKVAVLRPPRAGRADHPVGVGRARPAGRRRCVRWWPPWRRPSAFGARCAAEATRLGLTDPAAVQRAGRWGGMDLEPGRAAVPRGVAMPGLLARRGPPRRRGQGGVRAGRGEAEAAVGSGQAAAAGGRLLGRGGVGRGAGGDRCRPAATGRRWARS